MSLTLPPATVSSGIKLHKCCDLCDNAKSLSNLLKTVLINQNFRELPTLKRDLRKHRSLFLNLLENTEVKNVKHRAAIIAAPKDGILFENEPKPRIVDPDFTEETIILSDLFNFNELRAAELLHFGESQKPRYPLWSRGLIAVMLYFDAKFSVVHSLKLITKAVSGLTWSADVTDDVSAFLEGYITDLINENVVAKILQAMKTFNVAEIFENLRKQKALGDLKHRRVLSEILNDIAVGLSDVISNLFSQRKMSIGDTIEVVDFLKCSYSNLLEGESINVQIPAVNLIISVFCAFDHQRNEDFIQTIHQTLVSSPPFVENQPIAVNPIVRFLCSVLYLKWAVSLRKLSMENELPDSCIDCRDEDEFLVNQAIASDVFSNISLIISVQDFFGDEFRVQRFHQLFTDFIVYFPLKVRDLRNHGDEVARTVGLYYSEGLSAPQELINDYENCLKMISGFYRRNNLKLTDDFWKVNESYITSPSKAVSNTQRYLSLHKFCLSACDYVAPFLYASVFDMLSSLSCSENSAWSCLEFLLAARQSASHVTVSLNHFFQTVQAFYTSIREERLPLKRLSPNVMQTSYYGSAVGQKMQTQIISALELKGIESMLGLLINICSNSERAIQVLVENSELKVVYTLFGLISCKVPLSLKAKCIDLLSAIVTAAKYAPNMWSCIEKYQLFDLSNNAVQGSSSGIVLELEEFETKQGCYNLSIGFVKFVNRILKYSPRKFNLKVLGSYLIDKLLNHFNTRFYEDSKDVYIVSSCVLDVIKTVVDNFDVDEDLNGNQAQETQSFSLQIASQLFKDSTLVKKMLFIIEKTVHKLETLQYGDEKDATAMFESCEKSLNIIARALQLQEVFMKSCSESYRKDIFMSMDALLQCLNSKSGFYDHLHNVMKLVVFSTGSTNSNVLKVRLAASEVLSLHAKVSLNQTRSCKYLLSEPAVATMLNHATVSIIEEYHSDSDSALNLLQYICSLLDFPRATVAHYLLGLEDARKPNQVLTASINALHAITYVLDNFIIEATEQSVSLDEAKVICLCYNILYKISLLRETCSQTLRLLQNIDWFLCRHIQELSRVAAIQVDPKIASYLFNANSWLVKTFAIDLKLSCSQKQQTSVTRMLSALFDKPTSKLVQEVSKANSALNFSLGVTSLMHDVTSSTMDASNTTNKKPWILRSIINEVDFVTPQTPELQVDMIDSEILERAFVISEQPQKDAKGHGYFDVRRLHKYLFDQISVLQVNQTQKEALLADIEYVLAFASEENSRQDESRSKIAYVTSWCELFAVCIKFAPGETLKEKHIVMDVLDYLCAAINVENLSSELSVLISRLVLNIIDYFRNSGDNSSSVDSIQLALELASSKSDVLKNLIKFYIYGGSNRKESLCVNTLSSILSYLRLFAPQSVESENFEELDIIRLQNWNVVKSFGDAFLRRLFSDSSLGHVVQKTIAVSVFCELMDVDEHSDIATLMNKEGFLQKIVLEISTDNIAMIESLQKADPFDAIYLMNNAKFCLISKLAQSAKGASALVHCNFIEALGKLTFIDCRPLAVLNQSAKATQKSKDLVAVQLAAHRQVFIPLLESCHNILTTLPPSHQDVASSVLQFIIAHFEVFIEVLSCRDFEKLSKNDLKEIKVACGVISAAAMKVKTFIFYLVKKTKLWTLFVC